MRTRARMYAQKVYIFICHIRHSVTKKKNKKFAKVHFFLESSQIFDNYLAHILTCVLTFNSRLNPAWFCLIILIYFIIFAYWITLCVWRKGKLQLRNRSTKEPRSLSIQIQMIQMFSEKSRAYVRARTYARKVLWFKCIICICIWNEMYNKYAT